MSKTGERHVFVTAGDGAAEVNRASCVTPLSKADLIAWLTRAVLDAERQLTITVDVRQ